MRAILFAGLVGLVAGPAFAQDAGAGGAELFETHCAVCHNSGGTGTPGLAPPLDRPEFWQALGPEAPTYISGIVTKGLSKPVTVRGERYIGLIMVPVATASDEELAQITSWVLAELGGLTETVSAGRIAEMRASGTTQNDLSALRPRTE